MILVQHITHKTGEGNNLLFFVSGTLFLVLLLCCGNAVCGFSSLCVIWCSSIVVVVSRVAWIPHVFSRYMQRIRGPTVSLGVVEPREFDVLAPAAQHSNVLLCDLWKYDTAWYFEKVTFLGPFISF